MRQYVISIARLFFANAIDGRLCDLATPHLRRYQQPVIDCGFISGGSASRSLWSRSLIVTSSQACAGLA